MKHLIAAVLTALLTVAGLAPGGAQAQAQAQAQDDDHGVEDQRVEWNRPAEPFTVISNVHYVGVEGLGAYLISTPEGHILIDGGLPESAPRIIQSIRDLGFDPEDVRIILNTHAHLDHAGGISEIQAVTGARFVASQGDRAALESGRHHGLTNYGVWRFPPIHVDQVVSDGEIVSLGGANLTAIVTPGHTAGCTNWSLPVQDRGRELTVLLFCSASLGGNILVGNTEYPTIVDDYRSTFDRLDQIEADVVLTNHPEMVDLFGRRQRQIAGDPDAFIDPAEIGRLSTVFRTAFERALAQQQSRVAP